LIISIDEVATGLLVNVISAAGRWLGTAAGAARSGRGRAGEDIAVARWFETYRLTERVPDLSGLSDKSAERLRTLLSGDDAQAALPVPEEFKQVFRDWAEGKVNFIGPAPDSADSGGQ